MSTVFGLLDFLKVKRSRCVTKGASTNVCIIKTKHDMREQKGERDLVCLTRSGAAGDCGIVQDEVAQWTENVLSALKRKSVLEVGCSSLVRSSGNSALFCTEYHQLFLYISMSLLDKTICSVALTG